MGFLFGDDDDAPQQPAAPDPNAVAAAQYKYNSQAARDAAFLNALDQYGPYGSTVYARRPDGTPYAQAVTLSPEVQAMLDAQFGAGTKLNEAAMAQLGYLPQDRFQLPSSPNARDIAARDFGAGALDYSSFADPLAGDLYNASRVDLAGTPSTQDIANTFYEQGKSRVQPDLAEARKAKDIELARRGIPVGSEIYRDEMDRLDRNEGNTLSDISRQAELAAGQEQSRQFGQNLSTAQYGGQEQGRLQSADLQNRSFLGTQQNQQFNRLAQALGYGSGQYQTDLSNQLLERNQPFAEYAALSGVTPQFQTPNFQGTVPTSVAPPDYTGVVNNNYAQQMAAWQQQAANAQSGSNSMWGAIGSVGSALIGLSDEDMKEGRKPADGEMILASFREMPVDEWSYDKGARMDYGAPGGRIVGPMAQDWSEEFGGDGKTIPMIDAVGRLMAAVKSLDERTAKRA